MNKDKMELEEAIENLKKQIENTKKASECGLATKGEFKEDIQAIETVLQALEDLQQKERSRIIGNIYEIKIEDLEAILKPYYIPKKKIEDKIYYLKTLNFNDDLVSQWTANQITINILQELLEGNYEQR